MLLLQCHGKPRTKLHSKGFEKDMDLEFSNIVAKLE